MTAVAVEIPKPVTELVHSTEVALSCAQTFVIECADDYALCASELKNIKARKDQIEQWKKTLAAPFKLGIKQLEEFFNTPILRLSTTESLYKRQMLAWDQKQQDARNAEQARLDEAARKEREKLEAAAAKAEKKGKHEQADALRSTAASVVAPVAATATAKVEGISYRTIWSAECVDIVELCRAVADGKVAPVAVEANAKFLNQQAVALKEHFNVPGCKATPNKVLASSKG
jgi:hypothetical protein